MVRCNRCGHYGPYVTNKCDGCGSVFTFTDKELEAKAAETEAALKARNYPLAEEGYHLLADLGDVSAMREYASILERGEIVKRDLDKAMKYFYLAASKNDAYSAYRYSRLAERTSEATSDFWLKYSAVIGCTEAYPSVAEKFSQAGEEKAANYFYAIAAACDHTDSIVTLAKRYYDGVGTDPNPEYAKWYMDKLTLPPIHAIRLAYRLRTFKAKEPPVPTFEGYISLLQALHGRAKKLGFAEAEFKLASMLSEKGQLYYRVELALLYSNGRGTQKDIEITKKLLESASNAGYAPAARELGNMYLSGTFGEKSAELALIHYRRAAQLGMTNAYELLGDVYRDGSLVRRDISEAIRYYELAAKDGHTTAEIKAEQLISERIGLLERGLALESSHPEEAFRSFAVATGMGLDAAKLHLGRCYQQGIGTKKDNARAFMWYEEAVECGLEDALLPLGLCYSRGIGTSFNFEKAKDVLGKAARLGSDEAKTELVRILENKKKHMLRSVYSRAMRLLYQKKYELAREALVICLKLRHPEGIYTLACFNEFGIGAPTNRDLAYRLYEASFDLGFRDPRAVYKLTVLRMARNYK